MSQNLPSSYNATDIDSLSSRIVDSSSGLVSGRFGAVQILQDTVILSITSSTIADASKLQTTFSAGTVLYGVVDSIQLTSGLVALHVV